MFCGCTCTALDPARDPDRGGDRLEALEAFLMIRLPVDGRVLFRAIYAKVSRLYHVTICSNKVYPMAHG